MNQETTQLVIDFIKSGQPMAEEVLNQYQRYCLIEGIGCLFVFIILGFISYKLIKHSIKLGNSEGEDGFPHLIAGCIISVICFGFFCLSFDYFTNYFTPIYSLLNELTTTST